MMDSKTNKQPILIELDEKSREKQLDQVSSWLDNLRLAQASYRQLLEDTIRKIEEPHIKQYLGDILGRAKQHEQKISELYTIIDRSPSKVMKPLGNLAGKVRQAIGDLLVPVGGVRGPWQDVHQVFLFNYNSMGAFAVAEQLGLALGIPQIVDITFPIVAEKSTDQLLLQEYVLEMCSVSILYKQRI